MLDFNPSSSMLTSALNLLCISAILCSLTATMKLPRNGEQTKLIPIVENLSDNSTGRNILSDFIDFSRDFDRSLIPTKNLKVLFVELLSWEMYHEPKRSKTGEYYVSATWDYALRQNGVIADRVSTNTYYERMSKQEISRYHRIFVRDPRWHRFYDDHSIFCRVRPMYFYGGWVYLKNTHNYRFKVPFASNQILSANKEEKNTFMGYFPHNLQLGEAPPKEERGKVGFLLGKKPEYFEGYESIINALLDAGFDLHSTCKDTVNKTCPLPSKVIRHGPLSPQTYSELMKQFSFMLGFIQPKVRY